MPCHPLLGTLTNDMSAAVFSSLVSRLDTSSGETFPLHVGDTWLDPTPSAQMQALRTEDYSGLHRYAAPDGYGPLREALLLEEQRKGATIDPKQLLITAGATAGLHCSLSVLLEPGDEVLILAPHWPLITGITRACRGLPVTVDVLDLLRGDASDASAFVERVERHKTDRTSVLYLSSPNNPTGRVIPHAAIEALVEWATANDLWVISDEVYEHYAYSVEHTHGALFDPERTLSAYSFSKAYGLAGGRCGYITGPKQVIAEATKVGTHTFYSTPTMAQVAGLKALEDGETWLQSARRAYREVGEQTAAILGVTAPEGGTFLFLDLQDAIERNRAIDDVSDGLLGVLEQCADRGLLLSPGPSFGPYPSMARFCFTCLEPAHTLRGAHLLRDIVSGTEAKVTLETRE